MEEGSGNGCFSLLPEGCISDVLSRTAPLYAIRSSAVSSGLRSAADSDAVWEKFLPSDYRQITSRSVSPVVYSSKKDLYFCLCDSPILIDDGKLSFSLDKKSGKKCYMIRARELSIAWGDTPHYWKWKSFPESRFMEVAKLRFVCWLDLRGKMETQMLSSKTNYAAYLVFKAAVRSSGLSRAKAYVRLVRETDPNRAETEAALVHLIPERFGHVLRYHEGYGRLPRERKDGWMEIELGEFYNDQGDDGEVEMRLIEIVNLGAKSGLIVEGMELRPKENA